MNLADLLREPFILQQQGPGVRTMLVVGLAERGLSLDDLNVYPKALANQGAELTRTKHAKPDT